MPLKCGVPFFIRKHGFLGLNPVFSDTTVSSKSYFILKLQIVRYLLWNTFFKSQKLMLLVTMALKPFTRHNFKTLPFLRALKCAVCWLSWATFSKNVLILMQRKLPLLGGCWSKYAIPSLLAKLTKNNFGLPFFLCWELVVKSYW